MRRGVFYGYLHTDMIKPIKPKRLYFIVFMAVFVGTFLLYSIKESRYQSNIEDNGLKAKVQVGTDTVLFHKTYHYFQTEEGRKVELKKSLRNRFVSWENAEVVYDKNRPSQYLIVPVNHFWPVWFGLAIGLFMGLCSLAFTWYIKKVIEYLKRTFAIYKEEL